MKKFSLFLVLATSLVFMSCETESLIDDELQIIEEGEEVTLEKSNLKVLKGLDGEHKIAGNLNSENSDFQPNNPNYQLVGVLEVYVDYTGVASQYGTPESIIPPGTTLKEYIKDYETEMSMNFTILAIEKSTSCDHIFKWYVYDNEYYDYCGYLEAQPPFENLDGSKKPLQTPKEDDDSGQFFDSIPDPYIDCFD